MRIDNADHFSYFQAFFYHAFFWKGEMFIHTYLQNGRLTPDHINIVRKTQKVDLRFVRRFIYVHYSVTYNVQ